MREVDRHGGLPHALTATISPPTTHPARRLRQFHCASRPTQQAALFDPAEIEAGGPWSSPSARGLGERARLRVGRIIPPKPRLPHTTTKPVAGRRLQRITRSSSGALSPLLCAEHSPCWWRVGDFDTNEHLALTSATLPPSARGVAGPQRAGEPPQTEERRVTVRMPGRAYQTVSHTHAPVSHPDYNPAGGADRCSSVARHVRFGATRRVARLYRALVETHWPRLSASNYHPSLARPGSPWAPRSRGSRGPARWKAALLPIEKLRREPS